MWLEGTLAIHNLGQPALPRQPLPVWHCLKPPGPGSCQCFPKINPSPLQALSFLPQDHSMLLQES